MYPVCKVGYNQRARKEALYTYRAKTGNLVFGKD